MKIIRLLFIAGMAHVFLLSSATADDLSAMQKREIIFDCTQVVADFAIYRDLPDPDKFARTFTESGRLFARGEWFEGYEGLVSHFDTDPENALNMHLMTSIKITPTDLNNATGVSYAAIAHEVQSGTGPTTLESFTVVGKYEDKFVRTREGWKIAERVFIGNFLKPGLGQ